MRTYDTVLRDGRNFEPATWLADEVLWASIKAPYTDQWRSWQLRSFDAGSQADIATSNWSRAKIFLEQNGGDPELYDPVSLHLGKLAAGLTCSVAHLTTPKVEWGASPELWILRQREAVESVLDIAEVSEPYLPTDEKAGSHLEEELIDCHHEAAAARQNPGKLSEAFYRMSLSLGDLAAGTTRAWLDFIDQHDGEFVMTPGATPRSTGNYIEDLRHQYNHLFSQSLRRNNMTNLEEPSVDDEQRAIEAEVLSLSVDERRTLTRGLTRTTIVGRHKNGLPITKEGKMLEELVRQNSTRIERREE